MLLGVIRASQGVIFGAAVCCVFGAQATEVPPTSQPEVLLQTSGPNAGLNIGDYYTNPAGGGSNNTFTIDIPCSWPADRAVDIDLYSAEIDSVTPGAGDPPAIDEIRAGSDDTTFVLTQLTDGSGNPVNNLIQTQTFTAESDGHDWANLATLQSNSVPLDTQDFCGLYELSGSTSDDDDNSFRIRVGFDDDGDIDTPPIDDIDGLPGSGDELQVGFIQATLQHATGGICSTLYEVVPEGLASIVLNNFDMDNSGSVTYYPPGVPPDPGGAPGADGIVGTVSGNAQWNGSTNATRVGDTITDPDPGVWSIVTCVGAGNQYVQEGIEGSPAFLEPPPVADLQIEKALITPAPFAAGQTVQYQIVVTNTGPQVATGVIISDSPANLSGIVITNPAVCTGGVGSSNTFNCTIASIASTASVTIQLEATVN